MKENKILSNVIKWIIIFGLLVFACVKNKEIMRRAILAILDIPTKTILICIVLANLYYVAEGAIISCMTKTCEHRLTIFQGISCSYMCAFYKLATLGSGTALAQLYYFNTKGIDVSRATGIALSQYTFQKITIGVYGVVSFAVLMAIGNESLAKYTIYMVLGVIVISCICIFLFIITVSKKISDFVMKIARRIIKPKSKLHDKLDKAENSVNSLQEQGRIIWKDKRLFVTVVLLNIAKFTCWYGIPGIVFGTEFDVNMILCLALMSVCNMIGCVMLAPSGVGTLDYVFTMFFASVVPLPESVAAALVIYRFFTWIMPFIIGTIPSVLVKKEQVD